MLPCIFPVERRARGVSVWGCVCERRERAWKKERAKNSWKRRDEVFERAVSAQKLFSRCVEQNPPSLFGPRMIKKLILSARAHTKARARASLL